MPFLDAKALEADRDGMAFLRSVIRPNFEQEETASLPAIQPDLRRQFEVPLPVKGEVPGMPAAPEPDLAASAV